jgi:Ca2+/Na+ antiporter
MKKLLLKKSTLVFIISCFLIIGGIILLIDSPIGDSFIKGFNDGYENAGKK